MNATHTQRRGFGSWTVLLSVTVVAAAAMFLAADGQKPKIEPEFKVLAKSETPTDLLVFADSRRLVGWITGPQDRTGEKVTIDVAGKLTEVTVERGNTFGWEFADIVRQQVKVRVAGLERTELPICLRSAASFRIR